MVALVRDELGHRRLAAGHFEVRLRAHQRVRQRLRIALVSRVQRRGHDDLALEIDRVLGLVREVRPTVLHPRDPAVGVRRRHPIAITDLLVVTMAIEAPRVLLPRVRDAFLLRQLLHVAPPGDALLAAHDASHRGVGLEVGGVDRDPMALQQLLLPRDQDHVAENFLEELHREALADHRQRRVVRRTLRQRQTQEFAHREAVAAAPRDLAQAPDPLEEADKHHPEEDPRRDRRPAHRRRVVRAAQLLDPAIEDGLGQELVQLPIERMPVRLRQLVSHHEERPLLLDSTTQRHTSPSLKFVRH